MEEERNKRRKFFSDNDFDKSISIGDELVFDKQDLKKIRIDLTWKYEGSSTVKDLDVCAFLLGDDGFIHDKADLVYFNSQLRWKTHKEFDDPEFSPLDGKVSTWAKDSSNYKNPRKWMEATLPISSDGSVIGSWDDMAAADDDTECGETMHILLEEVDTRKYTEIVFAAALSKDEIENLHHSFADTRKTVATIYDADSDELIVEYQLGSDFPGKDVVRFGKVTYDSETMIWSFSPLADGNNGGMMYLATEVFN